MNKPLLLAAATLFATSVASAQNSAAVTVVPDTVIVYQSEDMAARAPKTRNAVRSELNVQLQTNEHVQLPEGEGAVSGRFGKSDARVMSRAERRAERDMAKTLKAAQVPDYQSLSRHPEGFTSTSPTPN